MRLSRNEIRSRAAAFAREWADAAYEKGETQSFYNEFFAIFGVRRRTVARYEEHVRRLDDTHGFIDLFWPGVLLVEQKSAGRDLTAARGQAGTYFDALPERDRPRYQLLCDFRTFELLDRDEREESRFALADLPAHVERVGFILGVQRRAFRDQDPVNVEASELVARLHDALKASGYSERWRAVHGCRVRFGPGDVFALRGGRADALHVGGSGRHAVVVSCRGEPAGRSREGRRGGDRGPGGRLGRSGSRGRAGRGEDEGRARECRLPG